MNVGNIIVQFLLFYLSEKYGSKEFFTGVLFLSTSFTTIIFYFQLFYFSECFLSFKVPFVALTDYRCLKFLILHQKF